jgi:hypothetical protein
MAGKKRGRPSSKGPATKKAKTVEPPGLAKKVDAIKAALVQTSLPKSTQKLLCVAVKDCLSVAKEERHSVQTSVVAWIGEALMSLDGYLKEKITTTQADLASIGPEKEALEKAKTDAGEAEKAKEEAAASKKAALKDAGANTKAMEVARKEADVAQKQGDVELSKVEQKNAALLAARTEAFVPLKDGAATEVPKTKLVKQVIKVGETCEFDPAMLNSLPPALTKPVEERGTFDTMVIQQFEDEYTKAIEAFDMAIRSGAPGKEERAAKVSAAKEAAEAALVAEGDAETALKAAKEELETAKDGLKTAESNLKAFLKANKVKEQAAADAVKEQAALAKGALAFYTELVEFDGKPPVKKPPQYKTINGMRYDWQLWNIAKTAGSITKEVAVSLFTSAMDGPGVTATEKRTLKYIIAKFPCDEESSNYLTTKMGTSWYQSIDGVTYERNLLTMAAEAAQPLTLEAVTALWKSAQDDDYVTPTEKASLEYIQKTYTFADEAAAFLKEKLESAEVEEA